MYEHRTHRVLPIRHFAWRFVRHLALVGLVTGVSLAVGILGYRYLVGLDWIDAFLNSAMLMGGMGPMNAIPNTTGKIFAGLYALYAGLGFMISLSILMAPVVHRVLHRLHQEEEG